MEMGAFRYQVAAFYSFTPIEDETITTFLQCLPLDAEKNEVMGTILVANEGVNGTICGIARGVQSLIRILQDSLGEGSFELKISETNQQAFRRFKVRRKAEIVTMGIPEINPNKAVGQYVEPSDWNAFLNDPDTLVIDTRNKYEIGIGSFKGS